VRYHIDTNVQDAECGGTVAITAQNLAVIDGGSISSARIGNATGAGGKVTIDAPDIAVAGGQGSFSFITAETAERGAAGEIFIRTGSLDIQSGGVITSHTSGAGTAGVVDITMPDTRGLRVMEI
jgi:large exoprotein involved in heme utilization and adhesion